MDGYNGGVRKRIKHECKARVMEQLGGCVGIKFLYSLPSMLIAAILYISIFGKLVYTAMSGNLNERTLEVIINENANSNVSLIAVLLTALIVGPLSFGVMQFYIALGKGERPGVVSLFKPFSSAEAVFAGIKMQLCLLLRSMLWMSAPTIAATLLGTILAIVFMEVDGNLFIVGIYTIYLIVLLLVEVKLKTYEAGWVLVCRNVKLGVWNATRIGGSAFYGRFGLMFVFMFSFLGWYLLKYGSVCVCALLASYGLAVIGGGMGIMVAVMSGIALACIFTLVSGFLSAYMNTSFIALYEYLSAQSNGPAGIGFNKFQNNDTWV